MGAALARSALEHGHEVVVISGPVQLEYPSGARVIHVVTTAEMLDAAKYEFAMADGLIGAAAPCDYMPRQVQTEKLKKTGDSLQLDLIETPDIVATMGGLKRESQWVVGFALETNDLRFRAIVKMSKKCCDMIVSNSAEAMNAETNSVEVILHGGTVLDQLTGSKEMVANGILELIQRHLVMPRK